jgi:hypothetical protein
MVIAPDGGVMLCHAADSLPGMTPFPGCSSPMSEHAGWPTQSQFGVDDLDVAHAGNA